MQSGIAFGIQMHFVINFAANFFFFSLFFTSFIKYFKGVAPYFSRSYKILVHLCIWQTRANSKRMPHSWNTQASPWPKQKFLSLTTELTFLWLVNLGFKNRFCDNVKLNFLSGYLFWPSHNNWLHFYWCKITLDASHRF